MPISVCNVKIKLSLRSCSYVFYGISGAKAGSCISLVAPSIEQIRAQRLLLNSEFEQFEYTDTVDVT